MAKPILFIKFPSEFFKETSKEKQKEIKENIFKQTDNEYHVILHDGIEDIKCVNGELVTNYL